MVTSKLFKLNQVQVSELNGVRKPEAPGTPQRNRTIREGRISDLEEHLTHLTQQKDLHTWL